MSTATHPAQSERTLPPSDEMLRAFMAGDPSYDGVFLTAVKTTGIFCRPSCSARKPRPENIEFFGTASDAVFAGYRPCKRCRPLESPETAPKWVSDLIAAVQADPGRRWRDADLRERGIDPERARRWFQKHHGMTFHAFARGLRLGGALKAISEGGPVTSNAMDHGFDSLSGFGEAVRRLTGGAPSEAASMVFFQRIDTPLGPMIAGAQDQGLCLLEFADRRALESQIRTLNRRFDAALVPGQHRFLEQVRRELEDYFAGRSLSFDVPISIRGTPFQEAVWKALLEIPAGETRSYADIARAVGRPGAVRAVGTANGANRLAIIIPCHRVIGADGRLAGYGGGLWRKEKLLELERAVVARSQPSGSLSTKSR